MRYKAAHFTLLGLKFFFSTSPTIVHRHRILAKLHLDSINDMQNLTRRLSRKILSSWAANFENLSTCSSLLPKRPFTTSTLQKIKPILQDNSFNSDFLKRGSSLGFFRHSSFATGFNPLERKPLNSIIDVERVKFETPEEITRIWDDYHLGRGHIGTTMKASLYNLLAQRGAECRYFVIPVPRGNGYVSMFSQVAMPHMLLTGLEDYKARGTQAAPYFVLTYYTEFAETKDLVLIRGDIVFASKLTDEEAKLLIENIQSFYLNDTRYKLVERLNKSASEFQFKDVLQSLGMPVF